MKDTKTMRYETQIQLVPSSMKQLNNQFALVDILLCYHGDNRNRTSMSKEVIEKALPSLYGIPIVGEYIYLDDGSQDFGSHGGKIIISDKGVKFEDTTKPYGFITKEAVDNAKWVTITEKDGFTQHEYLELKSCIVWEKRYEEVSSLLDKNYGQSMEIVINSGYENENGYYVIDNMTFSAACILGSNPDGTNVIPCFESACIGRHNGNYSLNGEFSEMFNEYERLKQYETGETPVQNNNPIKKEENTTMDYAKIVEKLSAFTYENVLGETVSKYSLIDVVENSIGVVDREDNKVYSFDCVESDGEIVIDTDSKTECSMTYKAMSETGNFDYAGEITLAQTTAQTVKETELSKSFSEEYDSKINEITETYTQLKADYDAMVVEYNKYKAADEARLEKEKHAQIDAVVEKYAKKIGRLPKFLCYRAKIDYTKDVADIENELILMAGEAMMDTSKQNFSYTPSVCPVSGTPADKLTHNDRYGNLFDKFITD